VVNTHFANTFIYYSEFSLSTLWWVKDMSKKSKKSTTKAKPKDKAASSKKTTKASSKPKAATKPKTAKKTSAKSAPKKTAIKPKPKPKTVTKTKTKKTPAKKTVTKRKPKPPVTKAKPAKPRRLPLEKPVKGVLVNFQRGTVRQHQRYGLIQLDGVDTVAEAASYIGRTVILHISEETKSHGRIIALHGRNGVLRARFRRSLASEALAKEVMVF
jgi:ribosomal protein L35AE/L33A